MKSFIFLSLCLAGVSATLFPAADPLDGHNHLHQSMKTLLEKLKGTKFPVEMSQEVLRSRKLLAKSFNPFLAHHSIHIVNPDAYKSLLQHVMFQSSRRFVNTSKALDNMAHSAVTRMQKAKMLRAMHLLSQMQTKLAAFFHRLHHEIAVDAQKLLAKHGLHIGMHHVHFLVHISARAIFAGKKMNEAVSEHLSVITDKPLPHEQKIRLLKASMELSQYILRRVRSQLHSQIKSYLAATVAPEDTHPIFMQTANHNLKPLIAHCPRSMRAMLGSQYHHYKELEARAFGHSIKNHYHTHHPNQHFLTRLHIVAHPIMHEHLKRVTLILERHGHHPQPSVVHYLSAMHLRPKDEEDRHKPWYSCILRHMHVILRIAWLVFAVVFGGAMLGSLVWILMAKCQKPATKVKQRSSPKKCKAKEVFESPTKLPYISLVEEKVPDGSVA